VKPGPLLDGEELRLSGVGQQASPEEHSKLSKFFFMLAPTSFWLIAPVESDSGLR
jgi:hypothetical protein